MTGLFPSFFDGRKASTSSATVATVATDDGRLAELSQLSQLSRRGAAEIRRSDSELVATVANVARVKDKNLAQLQVDGDAGSPLDQRAADIHVTRRPTRPWRKSKEGFDGDRGKGISESEPSLVVHTEPWQVRVDPLEVAGLPSEWAEPFARLLVGPPPGDFDQAYWSRVVEGANVFADTWAAQAHRLGWTAEDVFGLDEIKPAARHDHKGIAWLLGDCARVIALDVDGADIVTSQGSKQRFYRAPTKACRR